MQNWAGRRSPPFPEGGDGALGGAACPTPPPSRAPHASGFPLALPGDTPVPLGWTRSFESPAALGWGPVYAHPFRADV